MILIGSAALKTWFPDFPRKPKDIDYILQGESSKSTKGVEFLRNDVFKDYTETVMKPNDLYTLKVSHLIGWNIQWEKHLFDVLWLQDKGCTLKTDLFYQLYNYWNTIHSPNKRSDLEMTAADFFTNALPKEISHDFLHTLINPVPTYTKVLKDNAEVEVSEEKFNLLTEEEKELLVREEVEVMAYERYKMMYYGQAYIKMLKKFIISHAPLWESLWIVENYRKLNNPRFNFFKTINDGLQKAQCSIC